MMRKLQLLLIGISMALVMAGCAGTKPIENIDNSPVPAGRTAEQVRAAIGRAGADLGWAIRDVAPGQATGTLNIRRHTAVVDIPYSSSGYDIHYKSSRELNAEEGNIHPRYNDWVRNLDHKIQAQLSII